MLRPRLRLFIVLVTALMFAGPYRTSLQEFETRRTPASTEVKTEIKTLSAVLLPANFLPVQSKNPTNLASGKILVANRNLGDPHFAHTVVLLLRYGADGAVGLILNRRTDVPLSRGLEGVDGAKTRKDPIFIGGPVGTPGVCALLQSPKEVEDAEHIFDGIYLVSAKSVFEKTLKSHPDPDIFHVYLGYAGWTKAQLEMEVKLGAWFIFPADESMVFNSDPDSLWDVLINKTELKVAQSRRAPADRWRLRG